MRASYKLQTAMIEVDDICDFDSLPQIVAPHAPHAAHAATDATVEIELTAEQMDALLNGSD